MAWIGIPHMIHQIKLSWYMVLSLDLIIYSWLYGMNVYSIKCVRVSFYVAHSV